jgi:hypothetical protein
MKEVALGTGVLPLLGRTHAVVSVISREDRRLEFAR